jgi:addiction module RelE/StbE family toxin
MLAVERSSQFKRDYKRMLKRGNKDKHKLFTIIDRLIHEESIPLKHRDHALVGNYEGTRE